MNTESKIIALKNLKAESIVIGVISLTLSILFLYWGLTGGYQLKIYSTQFDAFTTSIFLVIISIAPGAFAIKMIIRFVSLLKFDNFAIIISSNEIKIPEQHFFSGYQFKTIPIASFSHVKEHHIKAEKSVLFFFDNENKIRAEFYPELLKNQAEIDFLKNELNQRYFDDLHAV